MRDNRVSDVGEQLLFRVLRYIYGKEPYDFSSIEDENEKRLRALEVWQEINLDIKNLLKERDIEL